MHEFFPKYKQGEEAVIINISSVCGLQGYGSSPAYCGTKHAVIGFSRSWGIPDFYKELKIKVIAVCPGLTITPMVTNAADKVFGRIYEKMLNNIISEMTSQE